MEAELDRLFHRQRLGLGDLGEGLGHALRVAGVQRNVHPVARHALELGDAGVGQARLDRQQADVAVLGARIVEQLGGAHGGAPGVGRQHALAVAGEEQAVDQLGLATRELADEGQGDVVRAQLAQGAFELGLDRRAVQPAALQPAAIAGDFPHQLALPGDVGVDLMAESFHAHPGAPGRGTGGGRMAWIMRGSGGASIGLLHIPARKVGQAGRAAIPSSSGNRVGRRMRTRFCRFSSPLSRLTRLLATPKALPRKASRWALALPSTGGAVRRIFRRSPCSPANSSRLALGCRWQSRSRSSPSQR